MLIQEIFEERIWLGWTEEQASFYVTGLTDEFIMNWKPINMIWSHWYVK